MNKKRSFFIVISLIVLICSVVLSFILNDYIPIIGNNNLILYIAAKSLSVLALISMVVLFFTKKDNANYIIKYITTLIIQFLPLFIRLLSSLECGFLISIIIFFVVILIYSCIVFGSIILSKKSIVMDEKLKGKEIPINENQIK